VADLELTRLLLVTGRSSFTASGATEILPTLREVAEVRIWSDFAPNPMLTDLHDGLAVVRDHQPDGVVAIGGGSAMDMAKLLTAFADLAPESVEAAVRDNRVEGRTRALVLAPTTSGSGSEATHFAVVYIGEEKFSVADPCLLPDAVVLDPDLTVSASPYQKATCAADAIAQAVESRWASGATAQSQAFAREALSELIPAAPAFVAGDADAASATAGGSHLAGRAIDLSKTTGAHAMAYGLTKRHGISHGHAVAVTLGAFARAHAEAAARRPDLMAVLDDIAELIGAADASSVGDRLDDLATTMGLQLRLSDLGVPRTDIPVLAGAVNVERLGNNPVPFTTSGLAELLNTCW